MIEREYIYQFCITEKNFKQLYADFYPALVVWARTLLDKEKDAAEDIVQDIFIRMWEAQSDKLIENISTYLYRAVKYRCLNKIRDSKSHFKVPVDVVDSEKIDDSDTYIQQESVRLIHKAIGQLPPRCREIFMMSLDGIKNREIAEKLGLAEETIKKQKKIARRSIKLCLDSILSLLL